MYFVTSEQEIPLTHYSQLQRALKDFLSSVEKYKENVLLHATDDLFADSSSRGYLYHLTDGSLSWFRDDEICFVIEQGDLIGIEEILGTSVGRYASEFAVRCDRFAYHEIQNAIDSSPEISSRWNTFIVARFTLFNSLLLQAMRGEKQFTPNIRTCTSGEVIIEEGTPGYEVYTLINGHAEVLVDGVRVGEVLSDEIFGALAALTDMPRTASVVATQDSMILSIERDKFLELIESRPSTVLKMVQDMARTIVDLNKKVVEKSRLYR